MKRYNSLKNLHYFFQEAVIHVDKYLNILQEEFNKIFNKIPIENSSEKICEFLTNFFKAYHIIFMISNTGISRNGVINGKTKNNKDIDIFIYCSFDLNLYFNNKFKFFQFVEKCLLILSHELVHRGQYIQMNKHLFLNKIDGKNIDILDIDKKYFSKNDELMAFANMIIEELRFNGYDNKEILDGIKYDKFGIEDSEFLELYRINFKNDKKILDKLYKNIYVYLKLPVKIEL